MLYESATDVPMTQEYLVSYGLLGDFGLFRSEVPILRRRGDAVVVRTSRGIELGEVLCAATSEHVELMGGAQAGAMLRAATSHDHDCAKQLEQLGQRILSTALESVDEQELNIDLLDVESLLDGEHVILHVLQDGASDCRPFVAALSKRFDLHVALQDLADPVAKSSGETGGCGDCGSGGCGSCGTSGGCGSGSCSSASPEELQAYFSALREDMHRSQRVSLL